MEEYPTGSKPPVEPEETGNRFVLLMRDWWAKVVDFAQTTWENLRTRERRPPPREGEPRRRWSLRRPKEPPVDPEEIARWITLLSHPDDPAHTRALDELVVIGKPAVKPLIQALRSDTWIQVFRACEALGLIGNYRATRHLIRLMNHPNSNVRWGAAEALGRIQARWARGRLRRAAREDESRTSWGETVAEAAERAVASIDQTWTSRIINVLQIILLLVACAIIVLWAYGFIDEQMQRQNQRTPTPTATVTPTPTRTPTPTNTPVPTVEPIIATIVGQRGNVRERPSTNEGAIIGVLNFGDEIAIYSGHRDEEGSWWYLMRLVRVINPATASEVLEEGAYGWIHSSLVSGVDVPQIEPTIAAIETMRARVATPTELGSSLDLPTPTLEPTATETPTPEP